MNIVCIVGRLTAKPELRYTPGGSAVLDMGIAVNEVKKDEKVVHFFNVTVWGATAENCNQYLDKGSQVGITGELRQQRWEKDGQKHSKVIINAQRVQFLNQRKPEETQEAI